MRDHEYERPDWKEFPQPLGQVRDSRDNPFVGFRSPPCRDEGSYLWVVVVIPRTATPDARVYSARKVHRQNNLDLHTRAGTPMIDAWRTYRMQGSGTPRPTSGRGMDDSFPPVEPIPTGIANGSYWGTFPRS